MYCNAYFDVRLLFGQFEGFFANFLVLVLDRFHIISRNDAFLDQTIRIDFKTWELQKTISKHSK